MEIAQTCEKVEYLENQFLKATLQHRLIPFSLHNNRQSSSGLISVHTFVDSVAVLSLF